MKSLSIASPANFRQIYRSGTRFWGYRPRRRFPFACRSVCASASGFDPRWLVGEDRSPAAILQRMVFGHRVVLPETPVFEGPRHPFRLQSLNDLSNFSGPLGLLDFVDYIEFVTGASSLTPITTAKKLDALRGPLHSRRLGWPHPFPFTQKAARLALAVIESNSFPSEASKENYKGRYDVPIVCRALSEAGFSYDLERCYVALEAIHPMGGPRAQKKIGLVERAFKDPLVADRFHHPFSEEKDDQDLDRLALWGVPLLHLRRIVSGLHLASQIPEIQRFRTLEGLFEIKRQEGFAENSAAASWPHLLPRERIAATWLIDSSWTGRDVLEQAVRRQTVIRPDAPPVIRGGKPYDLAARMNQVTLYPGGAGQVDFHGDVLSLTGDRLKFQVLVDYLNQAEGRRLRSQDLAWTFSSTNEETATEALRLIAERGTRYADPASRGQRLSKDLAEGGLKLNPSTAETMLSTFYRIPLQRGVSEVRRRVGLVQNAFLIPEVAGAFWHPFLSKQFPVVRSPHPFVTNPWVLRRSFWKPKIKRFRSLVFMLPFAAALTKTDPCDNYEELFWFRPQENPQDCSWSLRQSYMSGKVFEEKLDHHRTVMEAIVSRKKLVRKDAPMISVYGHTVDFTLLNSITRFRGAYGMIRYMWMVAMASGVIMVPSEVANNLRKNAPEDLFRDLDWIRINTKLESAIHLARCFEVGRYSRQEQFEDFQSVVRRSGISFDPTLMRTLFNNFLRHRRRYQSSALP